MLVKVNSKIIPETTFEDALPKVVYVRPTSFKARYCYPHRPTNTYINRRS